jgi:hypothetical protein
MAVWLKYNTKTTYKGESSWLLQDQVYAALAVQEQVAQLGSILLLTAKAAIVTSGYMDAAYDELALGDVVTCVTSTTPPTAFVTYVKARASDCCSD